MFQPTVILETLKKSDDEWKHSVRVNAPQEAEQRLPWTQLAVTGGEDAAYRRREERPL